MAVGGMKILLVIIHNLDFRWPGRAGRPRPFAFVRVGLLFLLLILIRRNQKSSPHPEHPSLHSLPPIPTGGRALLVPFPADHWPRALLTAPHCWLVIPTGGRDLLVPFPTRHSSLVTRHFF